MKERPLRISPHFIAQWHARVGPWGAARIRGRLQYVIQRSTLVAEPGSGRFVGICDGYPVILALEADRWVAVTVLPRDTQYITARYGEESRNDMETRRSMTKAPALTRERTMELVGQLLSEMHEGGKYGTIEIKLEAGKPVYVDRHERERVG